MPQFDIPCTVFDPIRISTTARIDRFIVDTWFDHGLITRSLFERIPGIGTDGTGQVMMSSGMYVEQPQTYIGVQIRNLRALPMLVHVVENGPAPLLLGGDFLALLFDMGVNVTSMSQPRITIETPEKHSSDALGIRLISPNKSIDTLELERFLKAVRSIHNVAVVSHTGLHQHDDWPMGEREEAKTRAVEQTIDNDTYLSENTRLKVLWVESGSIWVSLTSGAKSGLSWLSQIFSKTMNARLQATMSEASSAEEAAIIQHMTREEIVTAKTWEQRRLAAEHFRETRNEWRQNVLEEIDFRRKIAESIKDPVVRDTAIRKLDAALAELGEGSLLPLVEHLPTIPENEQDPLPVRQQRNNRG